VLILARDVRAAQRRFGDKVEVYADLGHIPAGARLAAVINLAGAPTAAGLWTKARKRLLLESRLEVTDAVLRMIERLDVKPDVLISASAVGYYGDRGDEVLTEEAGPSPRFMSDLCRLWEEHAQTVEALGVRLCLLRLGLIFERDGGPLRKLRIPAGLGFGLVYGDGRQWLPWMHRDDVIRVIDAAISDPRYVGPLNLATPSPITQIEFARRLAHIAKSPLLLRAPTWLLRGALGEFADLFLASQRISAEKLERLGFRCEHLDLDEVLRQGRPKRGRPA